MSITVLRQDELPWSAIAREFVGADHGGVGICVIFVDAEPGRGPSLHTHPYHELFVLLEGEATLDDGEEERVVRAGDLVVIPPGQPHGFANSGEGRLRQIDIHVSPSFSTEWLTEGGS
jgi:mannose-6-phosphate isomerase-like protein (cupin superfamily)